MGEEEMVAVAALIAEVLAAPEDEARIASVGARVLTLSHRFPLYEERE
jgi:glycine/serine hydroxymethyltransferase